MRRSAPPIPRSGWKKTILRELEEALRFFECDMISVFKLVSWLAGQSFEYRVSVLKKPIHQRSLRLGRPSTSDINALVEVVL
jgi:hypothetical protein